MGRHLQFVVMKIERHPHQGLAEPILAGGIEVKPAVAIAVGTPMYAEAQRALICFGRGFPRCPPHRGVPAGQGHQKLFL